MQYLNFDLEISPGSGGSYPTAVRLPAGTVPGILRFPFEKQTLELYLSRLETALLRSRVGRRQVLLPQETAIRDFGAALFDALIAGDGRLVYDQRRARAREQGMGVRIRLLVQAPDLATLPWEYLRDSREADFLCLSPHTPLVRYVKLPQPLQPLKVQPPLRILGMVASPTDQDPLDVAGEQARLTAALQPLEVQGMVQLRWVEGQTWQALQETTWHGPWHVFHFIGHGGFNAKADEGMLALADPQGTTHLLPGSQLGRLLANGGLRLVVLNACEGAKGSDRDLFSSAGASLVRREIPAVVAMQAEISDAAALEFTRTFYRALAFGIPVDAALAEARTAIWISIPNTLEWGTPVLYLRAPDGVLFELAAPPETPTSMFVQPSPSAIPQSRPALPGQPVTTLLNQSQQPAKQLSAQRVNDNALVSVVLGIVAVIINFGFPIGRLIPGMIGTDNLLNDAIEGFIALIYLGLIASIPGILALERGRKAEQEFRLGTGKLGGARMVRIGMVLSNLVYGVWIYKGLMAFVHWLKK